MIRKKPQFKKKKSTQPSIVSIYGQRLNIRNNKLFEKNSNHFFFDFFFLKNIRGLFQENFLEKIFIFILKKSLIKIFFLKKKPRTN